MPDGPPFDDPEVEHGAPAPQRLTLMDALLAIQRRGGVGRISIADAIEHAGRFVRAATGETPVTSWVDLGAGGGLPGLVVAVELVRVEVLLVERRAKRCDLLRLGVRSLALGDRVGVFEGDASRLPDSHREAGFFPVDVVSARAFGPPEDVLGHAVRLLRHGGVCLVSDPPQRGPRAAEAVDRLGFVDEGSIDGIRRYRLV